jgi:hypothetical protein
MKPDVVDVAGTVDRLLTEFEPCPPIPKLIATIREKTGTERSDADLEALIIKKAAVRGVNRP